MLKVDIYFGWLKKWVWNISSTRPRIVWKNMLALRYIWSPLEHTEAPRVITVEGSNATLETFLLYAYQHLG